MKSIKAKRIITIIGIMMIVFSWIHYGKLNITVGVLCLVLVLIFMIWRYSDKSETKDYENKK
ncbi:hypothetical protein [Clostridium estertheticum]|uniref:Uncharacterized protein n=1 Tax=Clostridium estertheticum TaxID=238834 RepID=A0A5N7IU69_9CLOT|nr:hypothetical protein [Clostridium estertheticum]MBU3187560.1 hypothetical protein [Clostridium estertheticum]MPQ33849.1 hypothetical protein [Clostridium estertheticum]MPQ64507.1 hypothetical protein [Clostridium estertheticum]